MMTKLEQTLIRDLDGPVASILESMPPDRREELNQQKPEKAKEQMQVLLETYWSKEEAFKESGMTALEAHTWAVQESVGLNP